MIFAATLMFSLQFVFTKCYQRERGSSFYYSMRFASLASLVLIPIFWLLNGMTFEFTPFSLVIACLYSIDGLLCCAFGVKTLSRTNLFLYTFFLMMGGMLLPFVYGLILGEKITVWKIVAVVLITTSMLVNVQKNNGDKKDVFTIICLLMIFVTNGMTGVLLYTHQRSTAEIVSSSGFMVLYSVANFVFSSLLSIGLYIYGKRRKPELIEIRGATEIDKQGNKSRMIAIFATVGYAVLNGTASLLTTITSKSVDASVQSTIVTGGCLIMSALSGLLFKEKITKKTILSIILALAGTVCIIL